MDRKTRDVLRWIGVWTAVFAANLIVPLMFGLEVTQRDGRIGMLAGVWVLWAAGAVTGSLWPPFRAVAPTAGILISLTQMSLIPHVYVGLVALMVGETAADAIGLTRPASTEVRCFTATVVMGQVFVSPIVFAALATSGVTRAGRPPVPPPSSTPPASPY